MNTDKYGWEGDERFGSRYVDRQSALSRDFSFPDFIGPSLLLCGIIYIRGVKSALNESAGLTHRIFHPGDGQI